MSPAACAWQEEIIGVRYQLFPKKRRLSAQQAAIFSVIVFYSVTYLGSEHGCSYAASAEAHELPDPCMFHPCLFPIITYARLKGHSLTLHLLQK